MRATLTAPALSLPAASLSAALLPPPGRAGRVHSIFRAAVNLEIESELIAVVARPSPRLPNGVHLADGLDFRALGLAVGAPVLWLDGTIVLGDALLIDLRAAAPWTATLGAVGLASAGQLADALRRGRTAAPPALLLAGPCRALLAALRAGNPGRIAGAAEAMVGLGPGLTPAGDDALLGCLAVLQAAGHRLAGALAAAVSAGARRRRSRWPAARVSKRSRPRWRCRRRSWPRPVARPARSPGARSPCAAGLAASIVGGGAR